MCLRRRSPVTIRGEPQASKVARLRAGAEAVEPALERGRPRGRVELEPRPALGRPPAGLARHPRRWRVVQALAVDECRLLVGDLVDHRRVAGIGRRVRPAVAAVGAIVASIEHVVPVEAEESVGAGAAGDRVRVVVAGELVRTRATDEVVDVVRDVVALASRGCRAAAGAIVGTTADARGDGIAPAGVTDGVELVIAPDPASITSAPSGPGPGPPRRVSSPSSPPCTVLASPSPVRSSSPSPPVRFSTSGRTSSPSLSSAPPPMPAVTSSGRPA